MPSIPDGKFVLFGHIVINTSVWNPWVNFRLEVCGEIQILMSVSYQTRSYDLSVSSYSQIKHMDTRPE